jgi:triacylglycerol lipase
MEREHWKNDYPVVLVHGFMGWGPDESQILGDYFNYSSRTEIQGENVVY